MNSRWGNIAGIMVCCMVVFKMCQGCFTSEDGRCLTSNEVAGTWFAEFDDLEPYGTADYTLNLNADGTFEAIAYKMNSDEVNFVKKGTWTYECQEEGQYDHGELIDIEYKHWVNMVGDAPSRRKTVAYVWYDGVWNLSAIEGKGFAISSDLFFEKQ